MIKLFKIIIILYILQLELKFFFFIVILGSSVDMLLYSSKLSKSISLKLELLSSYSSDPVLFY